MNSSLFVDEVRFTPASRRDRASGLLGYIAFRLNRCLRADGVTLRRTAGGQLTLSYPERRDRRGFVHPYLQPLDDWTRREIEEQVIEALGFEEDFRRC